MGAWKQNENLAKFFHDFSKEGDRREGSSNTSVLQTEALPSSLASQLTT